MIVGRFTLACLLALSFATAGAQTVRDGNWWRTLDVGQKTGYIAGFWDGREEEAEVWGLLVLASNKNNLSDDVLKWVIKLDDVARKARSRAPYVTSGQLSDGVTKVYSDYRNRTITIRFAIRAAMKEITGGTQTEVEDLLIDARKRSAE